MLCVVVVVVLFTGRTQDFCRRAIGQKKKKNTISYQKHVYFSILYFINTFTSRIHFFYLDLYIKKKKKTTMYNPINYIYRT